MRTLTKSIGFLALLVALGGLLAPSNAYADNEPGFSFDGLSARYFSHTGIVVVNFGTIKDSSVDYYEIQMAAVPNGTFQTFGDLVISQKTQAASYNVSELLGVNPRLTNTYLAVRVIAHFTNGDTAMSDPAFVVVRGGNQRVHDDF